MRKKYLLLIVFLFLWLLVAIRTVAAGGHPQAE
jgi:hypothetical protein